MKHVTLDDALDALRKAVAEKGHDYQNGEHHLSCYYASIVEGEAQPACIMGHALVYLGVPAEHLAKSGWNTRSIKPVLGYGVLDDLGYRFDKEAIDAFAAAQAVQDKSRGVISADTTWGAALAAAENISENCSAQVVTS